MSSVRNFVIALTIIAIAIPPARAEEPLANVVKRSIDRGVAYLQRTQEDRGGGEWNWENSGLLNQAWSGGTTSLATLALLTSGVPKTDRSIERVLPYIRKLRTQQTYVLALQAMVLAEVNEPKDLNIIQNNVNKLLEGRLYNGKNLTGWSYTVKGNIQADNSNTQYALLGLLAGRQAGVKIDQKDWEEIQRFYIDTQVKVDAKSAGWPYHPGKPNAPSHTMTTAGLSGLFIAGLEMNAGQQKLDEKTGVAAACGIYAENDAVARGMNWLGTHFKFDMNGETHPATFYNVYGIERVGRLSGQRFIGTHDWYREGCELLCGVKKNSPIAQGDDGAWRMGQSIDNMPVLSTSFALLFLSKGRTPILLSKLAFDGPKNLNSDWNRKHHDARNLVDYASKALFKKHPLAWQIFDPRLANLDQQKNFDEELTSLLQSPILYMNGHVAPQLTERQIELLRRYVDEGGFIFAEACCGSPDFVDGFTKLMEKVFQKEAKLTKLGPEHPVWSSHMPLDPTDFMAGRQPKEMVQGIERGCKTVVIFCPQPLAGFWEEARFMPTGNLPPVNRGELAYRFAGNVIAYATGLEMPKPRLTQVALTDRSESKDVTRHALKLAQVKHDGDWKPAPQAMRILANHLLDQYKLQVASMNELEEVRPARLDDLMQYKFMYMHGRREFNFDPEEIVNIRSNLRTGATLFADACCGSKEYDKAFRAFMAKLYPDKKLERIPLDDFLFSEKLNGQAITSVKCRRDKADGGAATEFEEMAPELEGIKVDGRWAVIYSRYDIGCALEKAKSSACRGHDHESAKRLGAAAVLYSLMK